VTISFPYHHFDVIDFQARHRRRLSKVGDQAGAAVQGARLVTQSNSELDGLSVRERLAYLWGLSLMFVERRPQLGDFEHIASDLEFYGRVFASETGRNLRDARILEIGYGQRPFRLMLLQSLGFDVLGVDLDQPLYRLGIGTIGAVFSTNGPLRAIKSLVRRILFDGAEYETFKDFIAKRYGRELSFDPDRMIVGDAANPAIWSRAGTPLDFVYSEDVFEHIPRNKLPTVVALMADSLSDNGLAVIKPTIFTGICGGHDLGWYPHQVESGAVARGPAWGHLTGESRPADTFLNKLTLREFRDLFEASFHIVREDRLMGDLGRRYLTPQRRQALDAFGEDELFSNAVRFVLRKKKERS
jgi:hypothetical protein